MKNLVLFCSLFCIMATCTTDDGAEPCTVENLTLLNSREQVIPGRYLVMFREGSFDETLNGVTSFDTRQQLMRTAVSQWLVMHIGKGSVNAVFTEVFRGFEADLSQEELAALKQLPEVKMTEPVRKMVATADCTTPPVDEPNTQVISYGTDRVGSGNGTGKRAWIIDTGIDLDHPDLNVNRQLSRNFHQIGAVAEDDDGHGTHVAGIIAAKNNTRGTVGVAWNAEVVAIKVLDSLGEGSSTSVLQGIDYVMAIALPGEVVNLSLGGDISTIVDISVQTAAAKGVFFTIAAGNEADYAANHSPARAEGANIFTISAIDDQDRFATSFSNFGNPPVDYAEPGVSILSTYKEGTYRRLTGTSMAAPHMAGILLLKGRNFTTRGTAKNDPDGIPDRIAVVN